MWLSHYRGLPGELHAEMRRDIGGAEGGYPTRVVAYAQGREQIRGNGDVWDGAFPVALRPSTLETPPPLEIEITLRYAPTGAKAQDDALLVAFDDGGLESYRVVVPIVVR